MAAAILDAILNLSKTFRWIFRDFYYIYIGTFGAISEKNSLLCILSGYKSNAPGLYIFK